MNTNNNTEEMQSSFRNNEEGTGNSDENTSKEITYCSLGWNNDEASWDSMNASLRNKNNSRR